MSALKVGVLIESPFSPGDDKTAELVVEIEVWQVRIGASEHQHASSVAVMLEQDY